MIWKTPVHGVAAETKQGAKMMELQSSERRATILKYKISQGPKLCCTSL